jgi:capsular exopolysaccharide synthesis family protein
VKTITHTIYRFHRWILFAMLPALLVGGLFYVRTAAEPMVYSTCAQLYVQQPDTTAAALGGSSVSASLDVIPTYLQMVTSPAVEASANAALRKTYPGYQIGAHAVSASAGQSVNSFSTSELIQVCADDTVPVRAAAAANAASAALIAQVKQIENSRYTLSEASIAQLLASAKASLKRDAAGGSRLRAQLSADTTIYENDLAQLQTLNLSKGASLQAVRMFSPATPPSLPIGPHPKQSALLAAFIVLFLCGGLIYAYEYIDDSPRSPEEIEEIVGAPILGAVRRFNSNRVSALNRGRHEIDDVYRTIRANLRFANVDNPLRSLVVTSALPAEGKSTTASNLARVFAEGGQESVLVDADLRRPSQHKIFEMTRATGLTGILVGTEHFNGHVPGGQPFPNLSVITSGPLPPRPADLLESARMREFVHDLEAKADVVVIDTPPLLAVADAAVLSTVVSGVVLVVDTAKVKRRDLKGAREAIEILGGNIVGVVINGLSARDQATYRYSYSGYYAYGEMAALDGKTTRPAERAKV